MRNNTSSKFSTEKMVTGAILTAIVIVLQTLSNYIPTLTSTAGAAALIPIVIGAAVCGVGTGTWLGFVFGLTVLPGPSGIFFMGFNIFGTIVTVLAKGIACGFFAGLTFKLLERINRYLAVVVSAVVCPVVNTAIFLLGCAVFFMEDAVEITGSAEGGFIAFFVMAMANFAFEVGINLILSPVIVKLINIKKKNTKS